MSRYAATVPRWIGLRQRYESVNARWVCALIVATLITDQLTKAAALSLLSQGSSAGCLCRDWI